jgi:hypothetical protein
MREKLPGTVPPPAAERAAVLEVAVDVLAVGDVGNWIESSATELAALIASNHWHITYDNSDTIH